ncbi:MAG TPA: hypothetical protein VKB88_26300 [Bryobacteraceae bacterium]|nr:hypothetical protein [Bryobacteraceae bacterium]
MHQFDTSMDNWHRTEKPKTENSSPTIRRSLCVLAMLIAAACTLSAQERPPTGDEDKRILWIFTNHRTTDDAADLAKLTPNGKFAIAWGDATDRAIFAQTAFISGLGQATNANPSFGQGVAGYAKRFGTTYGDFAIENLTTEGIFPALLHQDPRYFRRREGTARSRLGYAMSRLFITRTDSGTNQFNFSEIGGAAVSLGISNAYYPDGRSVGNNLQRYAVQLGFDAASNVLKEFWPDLKRKLPRRLVAR